MTKHTAGPWFIGPTILTSINTDKKHIAIVNYWKDGTDASVFGAEHKANAHLIAAAPELLEALEKVAKNIYMPEDWEDEVTAAIAKATQEAE